MKFAIIAAGEGSRLNAEGVSVPKPLVKINGEVMIDRLIRIFMGVGADEIVVIVNQLTNLVKRHLEMLVSETAMPLRIVAKTTESSMHSFYEISPFFKGERFCLTTVDTIFREDEFSEYIKAFRAFSGDGLLAVTSFVDDEKPLYVATDEQMNITGFNDNNCGDRYVSGGVYCLGASSLHTLARCVDEGQSRMRNFQRGLIADGLSLKAYPFSKIVDVDHANDIKKAEDCLNSTSNNPNFK